MNTNQQISIVEKIQTHFSFIEENKYFPDDIETRNIYKVTVKYNGKSTSFRFGDSVHDTQNGIMMEDQKDKKGILENICMDYSYTKDNYPTYPDFASEFGYDEDSIKGMNTYKACLKQAEKLHKVFTEDDIELIRTELEL